MLSKSSKQLERQKAVRPPSYRIENEHNTEAMPQYFQITVNIIEGRKLAWFNPHSANSFAVVIFEKKKFRTSLRRNMLEPYYNEVFTFDTNTNIEDLLRASIWIAVMEPRCYASPRILGETMVDMKPIWCQWDHQVLQKWVQLYLPRNHSFGPVGFLKLSISITFRNEMQVYFTNIENEKLEESFLLSGLEQQCANYQITIYEAFGLTYNPFSGDRRYAKPPSTYVKVSFCALVGKTAIQHRTNNPKYCEQIAMVEMFPNMNRVIRVEVWSTDDNFKKPLASTHLSLENISYDGENGFLPTFGPSLLHMYGSCCGGAGSCDEGPYYRGAILISLNIIVPYYQNNIRTVIVEPVTSIIQDIWLTEMICLYCPVLEVSMLDREVAGKYCGVAITFGEIPSSEQKDEGFQLYMNELRAHKYHYTGCMNVVKSPPYGYLDFCNAFPVLQIATCLPDFRFRMYKRNVIEKINKHLETTLKDIEKQQQRKTETTRELFDKIKSCLNDTACSILNFLRMIADDTINENNINSKNSTDLDKKELALLKEETEKIYNRILHYKINSIFIIPEILWETSKDRLIVYKKEVKSLLAEAHIVADRLKKIVLNAPHGWPDVIVWLLNDGSRVAYTKLSPVDILYSDVPEQMGNLCGKIQTLHMKPIKCPYHNNPIGCTCVVGKVEITCWLGSYHEKSAFEVCLPPGYILKPNILDMCLKCPSMMIEIRAFIYKAKIINKSPATNQRKIFVRFNIFNMVKETEAVNCTNAPTWNQLLKTQKVVFIPSERLWRSPPVATVEVVNIDNNTGETEIIGRTLIECAVEDRQDYEFAPKLEWHEIRRGLESSGQIFMSIQIVQALEKLMKSTIYSPLENSFVVAGVKDFDVSDVIESLPSILIPPSGIYKVDVYWWGLRDVNITRKPCVTLEIDDVVIKSNVIIDKKNNCNFQNGRMSGTFEAPLDQTDLPLLNIRLHDSSTFGRTLYLGANAVKNSKKFMVDSMPKQDREASLHRASVISSDFVQVSPNLCVKKNSQSKETHSMESSSIYGSMSNIRSRKSNWHRLCCSEPAEEEYTLLPVKNKNKRCLNKCIPLKKDWWSRYMRSLENYACKVQTTSDDNMTVGITRIATIVLYFSMTEYIIRIYGSELERQPEFSKFRDWCSALKLYYNNSNGYGKVKQLFCGHIKAGLAIYRWPPPGDSIPVSQSGVELNKGFFDDHPNNDPTKFLVRVYIIKAFNLKTREFGKSDPYTVVSCGKKLSGNRADYVANSWNPIFGKAHEFRCIIPEDYKVTVSLYDYNTISPDELIGFTSIDLEDRIYSKHRGRVGLANEYTLSEPTKWRDCIQPSVILDEVCKKNHLPPPLFLDSSAVVINDVKYVDDNQRDIKYSSIERKENLCLSLLLKWHTIPICGYHLVPEHVETRTLYKDDKPGIEQGKLHMWIDIFPLESNTFIPPPLEIKPIVKEEFELQLSIIAVRIENEKSDLQKDLELFIRASIGSRENAQENKLNYTDERYNCRMIFNFQYNFSTKKLYMKDVFTEFEDNLSPVLMIEIINKSKTITSECLGTLELNLNEMSQGSKNFHECKLEILEMAHKIYLFTIGSHRAWWPLQILNEKGDSQKSGSIEMDLNLICLENNTFSVALEQKSPMSRLGPSDVDASSLSKKSCEFCQKHSKGLISLFLTLIITTFVATSFYFDLPAVISYSWFLLCS